MRILTVVTSSLLGDYDEIVRVLGEGTLGYYDFECVDSEIESYALSGYDAFFVFADDSDDILQSYESILAYVSDNNIRDRMVVYSRRRGEYTAENMYFAKKNTNKNRAHRFVDFENIYDIMFDILIFSGVIFGADINVHKGMLRLRDYDLVALSKVSALMNNDTLSRFARLADKASREKSSLISSSHSRSPRTIIDMDKANHCLAQLLCDMDEYLVYAVDLYREIIVAYSNEYITNLDYIFIKEYYRIGHFTSIVSCFHRNYYRDNINDMPTNKATSILKIGIYSTAFDDYNEFATRTLDELFKVGKRLEKSAGTDIFFHFMEHEYYLASGRGDENNLLVHNYLKMIDNEALKPNNTNTYMAYYTLVMHCMEYGMIGEALVYARKCSEYVSTGIERVNIAYILANCYRLLGDRDKVKEQLSVVYSEIAIMDEGYHNSYAKIAMRVVDTFEDIDDAWVSDVADKVLENEHVALKYRFFFTIEKVKRSDCDIRERISTLEALRIDILDKIYVQPNIMMSILCHNATITAELYDEIDRPRDAMSLYNEVYDYMTILENITDDIDDQIAYVEYKIGELAVNMPSMESFRKLVRAEKRTRQVILSSGKYLAFYVDILISISKRFFADNRYKIGAMVSRNNLEHLVECHSANNRYAGDVAIYSLIMATILERRGLEDERDEFLRISEYYVDEAKRLGCEIDYAKVQSSVEIE